MATYNEVFLTCKRQTAQINEVSGWVSYFFF